MKRRKIIPEYVLKELAEVGKEVREIQQPSCTRIFKGQTMFYFDPYTDGALYIYVKHQGVCVVQVKTGDSDIRLESDSNYYPDWKQWLKGVRADLELLKKGDKNGTLCN